MPATLPSNIGRANGTPKIAGLEIEMRGISCDSPSLFRNSFPADFQVLLAFRKARKGTDATWKVLLLLAPFTPA